MTEEITEAIEANAARLDQALWSSNASVTARFLDRQRVERTYNLEGAFLYQAPRSLRVDLRPGVGDQVMQIGSNDDDYWVWIEPEMGLLWWGRYRYLGRPCAGRMAVRPDQLVAALMLDGLPRRGGRLIGPARKHGNTYDILYYVRCDDAADRAASSEGGAALEYRLDREYWVERVPPFMVRVVQFRDALGRVVTSALLDDYRPAWDGGPLVPHTISMHWPLDDGRFTLMLTGLRGMPADKVSPRAFLRPTDETLPPGVREVVQVDADCEPLLPPESPETPPAAVATDVSEQLPPLRPAGPSAWPPLTPTPDWFGRSDPTPVWIGLPEGISSDWISLPHAPAEDGEGGGGG